MPTIGTILLTSPDTRTSSSWRMARWSMRRRMSTSPNLLFCPGMTETTWSELNVFASSCSCFLFSFQFHQVLHPSPPPFFSSLVSPSSIVTTIFHPSHSWNFHQEADLPSSGVVAMIRWDSIDRACHRSNSFSWFERRRCNRRLKSPRGAPPRAALDVGLLSKLLLLLHKGGNCESLRLVLLCLWLSGCLLVLAIAPSHLLHCDVVIITCHLLSQVNFNWRLRRIGLPTTRYLHNLDVLTGALFSVRGQTVQLKVRGGEVVVSLLLLKSTWSWLRRCRRLQT